MQEDKELVIATRNAGKVAEIREILQIPNLRLLSNLDFPGIPEVVEDSPTYAGNAIKKAMAVFESTGRMALADDSGLEVDWLDGRPGVLSARFSGVHGDDRANICKLLSLLRGVPPEKRTARFRCVVAFVTPRGEVRLREGTCEGVITEEPRGNQGFGYDPVFMVPEYGKTFAELGACVKNNISHRARALNAIRFDIMAVLGYNI